MNAVANYAEYKKKFNLEVVYVGDIVEWKDFTGEVYEGRVAKILHKPLEGFSFSENVECAPLWEKEDYSIVFVGGLSVVGEVIVRKILKSGKKKLMRPNFNKVI